MVPRARLGDSSLPGILEFLLPCFHYAYGIAILIMAMSGQQALMGNSPSQPMDFFAYYGAAQALHHAPSQLYAFLFYTPPYVPEIAGSGQEAFTFINPPTFALILYPLGAWKYAEAYGAWCLLNLALTAFIWQRMRRFANAMEQANYRNLLASLTIGLVIWAYALSIGQVSIFLCLATVSFLWMWKTQRASWSGFWLGIALCVKPHFFIPLLAFLVGNRQWRLLAFSLGTAGLFVLGSFFAVGWEGWMGYAHAILTVNQHIGYKAGYELMINLRGWLSAYTGYPQSLILQLSLVGYALAILLNFLLGRKRHWERALPLAMTLAWFFAPWLHVQDLYGLLPVAILLFAGLGEGRARWLLPSYIAAAFFWPQMVLAHRIALLGLLLAGIYATLKAPALERN